VRRAAVRLPAGLTHTSYVEDLLGMPIAEFLGYLERQFLPGMSWANFDEWEIDHIKPIASFDLSDARQRAECFHFTNFQPLWAGDNRAKSYRI
jgi:hypothetical protein